MKSRLFNIPKLTQHPVHVQYDHSEKHYSKLHYHEEVQITYVKKGEGMLLCGSSSIPYANGNLFIIGSMIPHVFIGDENVIYESISVYFKRSWLHNIYPESPYLNHFLQSSEKGLFIAKWKFPAMVDEIMNKAGLYRINAFLGLIEKLSETSGIQSINVSPAKMRLQKNSDSQIINEVFKFISDHLDRTISLDELAAIANLTPPSFSRFFRQKTGKPVSRYIAELRIEMACRLLRQEDFTIEEIGYKSGYNNFSNFLRQFKKIKGMTPKEFRRVHYTPLKI